MASLGHNELKSIQHGKGYIRLTLVYRFLVMAEERYTDIHQVHKNMSDMNRQVQLENALALKLRKQLEHERIVLEERKAVSYREYISMITVKPLI